MATRDDIREISTETNFSDCNRFKTGQTLFFKDFCSIFSFHNSFTEFSSS